MFVNIVNVNKHCVALASLRFLPTQRRGVGFVIVSTADWPFNHLSLYKFTFSDIVIVQHPVSVYVPRSYKVTLSVRAEGTGILNYQWFKSSKEEVCGC
jgi:hypothetical protein